MTETNDPQLQLKKRARRRLVGAVAFAGLAAVVLPMIMDEEPKPPVQNVQIRIPGQDQLPLKPVATPSSPLSGAAGGEKPVAPPAADAAVAKASPGASLPGKAADQESGPPAGKAGEKPSETRKPGPPVEAPGKPAARTASKPTEKTPPQKPSKPAAKPVATDKRALDEQQRAKAILTGKSAEAAAGKARAQHFIQIGTFSEAENAKQVQGKIGGAGVGSYTEVLNASDGPRTRVRAGPFPNREAADKALEKLKQVGVTGVVVGKQ